MNVKRQSSAQSIVKGLLITSVIFFHAKLILAMPNTTSVLSEFNILMVLFPFLMMVFFFYAGYNYSPEKRTPWQNIKRRSLQLLIPLVVTAVVATLLIIAIRVPNGDSWTSIGNGIIYSLLSEPFSLMIGFPASGEISFYMILALGILWFLYALYIISIFFFLIVDYAIKKPVRLISIIVGLLIISFLIGQYVGTYLPYTVQCYPVVLAMMLFAAYLKQHNFLDRKIESKKDLVFTITNALIAEGIIVGIGLFGYYTYGATMIGCLPGGKFDEILKGFDVFAAFVIGFLGTYTIHQASRLITKIPVLNIVLDWYGNHSSYVYLAHPIILCFVHTIMFSEQKSLGNSQPYVYTFITIGLLVTIFLIVDYIIFKIKSKKPLEEATS